MHVQRLFTEKYVTIQNVPKIECCNDGHFTPPVNAILVR